MSSYRVKIVWKKKEDLVMNVLTARTLITISIWFGVTIILTFGLFKIHFNGVEGLFILTLLILSAAVITTTIIWLCKPPGN